jgi:hypothetical protein
MFYMTDDAEWNLILALEILAAELRRQGMSKSQVREILNLRFRGGAPPILDNPHPTGSTPLPRCLVPAFDGLDLG